MPKTFTSISEVMNFLSANPNNEVRDSEGDVIRCSQGYFFLENGTQVELMKSQGPWVELAEKKSFDSIVEAMDWLGEVPGRCVEDQRGHLIISYETKTSGGKSLTCYRDDQGRPAVMRDEYAPWNEHQSPVQATYFTNPLVLCNYLVANPGREVKNKHGQVIFFGERDGSYAFRYGLGNTTYIEHNSGPWTLCSAEENRISMDARELFEELDLREMNSLEKIKDFLKRKNNSQ